MLGYMSNISSQRRELGNYLQGTTQEDVQNIHVGTERLPTAGVKTSMDTCEYS